MKTLYRAITSFGLAFALVTPAASASLMFGSQEASFATGVSGPQQSHNLFAHFQDHASTSTEPEEVATAPGLDEAILDHAGTVSHAVTAQNFSAVTYRLPQAPALAEQLQQHVEITQQQWDTEFIDDGRHLTLETVVTASAQNLLAIRVETTVLRDGGTSVDHHTYWYDATSDEVISATKLFTPTGADSLLARIRMDVLNGQNMTAEQAQALLAASNDELLGSLNFTPDADLVVEFGESAGHTAALRVEPSDYEPWLSTLGRQALAAATEPETLPLPADYVDCTEVACVALTFDDGPGARTGEVLDVLKKHNAQGTFFVLGPLVEHNPQLVQRMVNEGHQVGNHTWTHPQLSALSASGIRSEMRSTREAIIEATGQAPAMMRPPYGDRSAAVDATLANQPDGEEILWDVDTLDWQHRDAGKVLDYVKKLTKPGSIILMHDIHDSTVDAVPAVAKYLRDQGYQMVTVEKLLESQNPQPGEIYVNGPNPADY